MHELELMQRDQDDVLLMMFALSAWECMLCLCIPTYMVRTWCTLSTQAAC